MKAYVAIGSNLGRREHAVLDAVRRLDAGGGTVVLRASSLYETEAAGMGTAPAFVNAVVQVRSLLPPGDLLKRVKTIENEMGRRGGHNQSREIDLDLIACGDRVMETAELVLPHPRFHERTFVLYPLREIAPGFVCPRTGRAIDDIIAGLPGGGVTRVSGRGLYP